MEEHDAPAPRLRPSLFSWSGATALTLAVGCGLRLVDYSHYRSLWLDEISLALNVLERDFAGLATPLDYNQGAPILFLWCAKLAVALWGGHELALRLVPLLFGVAGLFVFNRLARQSLDTGAAWAATAFLCLSSRNIFYSVQFKQYSADVFCCALVLLLGLNLDTKGWTARRGAVFGLAGAVTVWLSHPSIFVLGGLCMVLFADRALRRDRRGLLAWTVLGSIFLVSFAVLYGFSLVHLNRHDHLVGYWDYAFLPFPPTSWDELVWLPKTLFDQLPFFLGEARWLSAALVVAGTWSLLRRNRVLAAVLLSPLVLTLVASALGKYPFGERLILFLSPVVFLLAGEGLGLTCAAVARRDRVFAAIFALAALVPIARASFTSVANPVEQQQFRQVVDAMSRNYQPGDGCYVLGMAWSGMRYYGPRFGVDPSTCVYEHADPEDERQVLKAADAFAGRPRVWFVISITSRDYRGRTSPFQALYDNHGGKILHETRGNGVSALLLDLR